MAIVSKNSNNWSLSLKVLLFSTAVLTMAILLKLSVPVAVQFMVSAVPGLWSTLLLWLTPPYLYVVINGIIITIAASSRYHHKSEEKHSDLVAPVKVPVDPRSDFAISLALDETLMLKNQEYERPDFGSVLGFDSIAIKSPAETRPEFGGVAGYESVVMKSPEPAVTRPDFGGVVSYESVVTKHSPVKVQPDCEILDRNLHGKEESKVKEVKNTSSVTAASDRDFDDFVINRSAWTPIRRETKEILVEKPPASVRFGHRKPVKASPEAGKTLGVSKPKRHDTLESTWKTITDGRPIPLARHLKKSDTWERESHGRHNNNNNSGAQDKFALKMKKSETFNERNNKDQVASSPSPSPGSGKLKKEPSLSQDELNRRVEAFIKKFNEEMRLQRQESLNQYKEMVQRGGH